MSQLRAAITAVNGYVPEDILTNFDLEKMAGHWKITSMTFNFKFQDGNTSLAQKAIENAKKQAHE